MNKKTRTWLFIIVVLILFLWTFASCSGSEKATTGMTDHSYDSLPNSNEKAAILPGDLKEIPQKNVIESGSYTKEAPNVSDSLKLKFSEAYKLVQRYAKESKALDPNFRNTFISHFVGLTYGVSSFGYNTFNYQLVRGEESAPNKMLTMMSNLTSQGGGTIGITTPMDGGQSIMSFDSSAIKRNSIAIDASVYVHELTHVGFNFYKQYQNDVPLNEKLAYIAQVQFLVWYYNGADSEVKFKNGENVDIHIPPSDSVFVKSFLNQIRQ